MTGIEKIIRFAVPTVEELTIITIRKRLDNVATLGDITWGVVHNAGISCFEIRYVKDDPEPPVADDSFWHDLPKYRRGTATARRR